MRTSTRIRPSRGRSSTSPKRLLLPWNWRGPAALGIPGEGCRTLIPSEQGSRRTRAAGRAIDLPVGEADVAGGELHIDRGQLNWLAGTAERRVPAEFFQLLHRRAARDLQRSPDRAGRDGVHADAL